MSSRDIATARVEDLPNAAGQQFEPRTLAEPNGDSESDGSSKGKPADQPVLDEPLVSLDHAPLGVDKQFNVSDKLKIDGQTAASLLSGVAAVVALAK